MSQDSKVKKGKPVKPSKERSDSKSSCCYVIDPCGCLVDSCGCYVDPCGCCAVNCC